MRISDWSSDVCSSDLLGDRAGAFRPLSLVAARAWFCRRGVAASQGRTAHVLARSPRCDRLLDFRPRAGAAGDGPALGGSVGQRLPGGPPRKGLGRWSPDLDPWRRTPFVGWGGTPPPP